MLRRLPLLLFLAMACAVHAQDIERIDLKKPVQLSGNLNFSLESYSVHGIEARRQPFTWMLSGAPTLTVLGVQMPFQLLLGNFENRFYQPFNQYGISPRYKWLTVHAGYRNVNFSPYTLAGFRMLGGGFEINTAYRADGPKTGLRFGAMYGRLNRSTALDSAQFANPLAFRPLPSYSRMAYAFKVGVGHDEGFFDMSYLHGWDVERSLNSSQRDSIAPQRNTAVGFSWRKDLYKKDKRRLFWRTDIGLSAYTLDERQPFRDVASEPIGWARRSPRSSSPQAKHPCSTKPKRVAWGWPTSAWTPSTAAWARTSSRTTSSSGPSPHRHGWTAGACPSPATWAYNATTLPGSDW
jgi:hypothetical protein